MSESFERFEALTRLPFCVHAFTRRIPGIDVSHDKAEALRRLDAAHFEIRREIGMGGGLPSRSLLERREEAQEKARLRVPTAWQPSLSPLRSKSEGWPLLTAEQIHSDRIAIVGRAEAERRRVDLAHESNCSGGRIGRGNKEFSGCDGLITNQRQVALGIHVADCCAVYIVDAITPAIGLIHSGKKGTELGIAAKAIQQMKETFGSNPEKMIVQLSPCIRPPHYEIDFAAQIVEQCREMGVQQIHDSGICTACRTDLYYSYRAEKGKTGRMLALLGLR
ncbi:MAG: purine-nucleoside/S-methyl-5-thioadenosine phosphorylase / adenosine deaminase [Verrucomicrobiota bacterium]